MIARLIHRDDGISLTELAVAMIVVSIVLAGMLTWTIATLREQERNRDAVATVDELRFAKSQLTREIRYASQLIPPAMGDDAISLWLDDGDGEVEVGEMVTYEVLADRSLVRYTDDASQPTKTIAQGLVADDTAFVVADSTVDITLTIDLDPTDNFPSRELATSISTRNIQE
jgi:type II secretory pathway pseudopilin PulG